MSSPIGFAATSHLYLLISTSSPGATSAATSWTAPVELTADFLFAAHRVLHPLYPPPDVIRLVMSLGGPRARLCWLGRPANREAAGRRRRPSTSSPPATPSSQFETHPHDTLGTGWRTKSGEGHVPEDPGTFGASECAAPSGAVGSLAASSGASNANLQSNKKASSYLQSKLRSSIGSSIGPVSLSPPLACDDDVVFPIKKKNKRAQHMRLQHELAPLLLSLEKTADGVLIFPLKKKNRLVQSRRIQCEVASLFAWIADRRAEADAEEDAKSDSLYPLAVSAGPVAHVVHARDRRGGVPARAARLGHINVAHYARPIVLLLLLVFPVVFGAGSDDANGKVPIFSGTPTDFHPWFILFSAYVAWKLTEASDILSGHESRPVVPAPISTPATPGGAVAITNATAISEAKAALTAWNTNNRKLYGLIVNALPDGLRTSIFNSHNNDGIGASNFLHTLFSAKKGSANDYAVQIRKIQASLIDPKADLDVSDLRLQYDSIITCVAAITRIGRSPPDDETLMVFFDGALPAAYTQIRQFVRDKKHTTFFDHYNDYLSRVDDEVSSRRPTAQAFLGRGAGRGRGRGARGADRGGDTGGRAKPICFRCLGDHPRPKCDKSTVRCPKCAGDHHVSLCPKGNDTNARSRIPLAGLKILDADVASVAAPAVATSPMSYANAVTTAASAATRAQTPEASFGSLADAHAAAAAVAANHGGDAQSAANAYAHTLRVYGFASCAVQGGRRAAGSPSMQREALVDSMATFWVVDNISYLWTITIASPTVGIETAAGVVAARAVGIALVQLLIGDK